MVVLAGVTLAVSLQAQGAPVSPAPFRSVEVEPDRSVIFRFYAPAAAKVELLLENRTARLAMQRSSDGVWAVTTAPLRPEIYGYRFSVDGSAKTQHDPQNKDRRYGNDLLLVPGHPPEPWEESSAPRGKVISHSYTTKIATGLPGNRSEYVVYTPPGYDPRAQAYPVLYLLHCWGDRPDSWDRFGQANTILDNLIAQHKARPMVVVMPLGYGEMRFSEDYDLWQDRGAVQRNLELFERALLDEVIPRVEAEFHVRRDAEGRAILGASMGGLESVAIGLNHGERFAWVGAESSALKDEEFASLLASFHAGDKARRLVWMVCGRDDELAESNRKLVEWLRAQGAAVAYEEPEGTHSYIVWREGLVGFASAIF